MAKSGKIEGIFVPNTVPLDEQGNVHEAELGRYTEWLINRGVHGLYPNGSTGEFLRFTSGERRRIVTLMADQAQGRVPILAGAAEANVRETISACEYYHSLGLRAAAIVSPHYYRVGQDGVHAYFKQIAEHSPIDVLLYNIPVFASPIDVATVERLSQECPRIVGIKDSSGDITFMMQMIQAVRPNRPDFSFLTGCDGALLPMLLIGCNGGTNASGGVVPEVTRQLYDLAVAGRIDEARELQYRLLSLSKAMLCGADFPEGFRLGVALRGFEMGAGRHPLAAEQQCQLTALRERLRALLVAFGFMGEQVEKL